MEKEVFKRRRENIFNCLTLLLEGRKVGFAEFDSKIVALMEIFSSTYQFSVEEIEKIFDYCEFQYQHAFGIEGL